MALGPFVGFPIQLKAAVFFKGADHADVYKRQVQWGGAGATVPLTGFGYSLARGVREAVLARGWIGVLTGGLSATAAGIAAAVLFSFLAALLFKPGDKR